MDERTNMTKIELDIQYHIRASSAPRQKIEREVSSKLIGIRHISGMIFRMTWEYLEGTYQYKPILW